VKLWLRVWCLVFLTHGVVLFLCLFIHPVFTFLFPYLVFCILLFSDTFLALHGLSFAYVPLRNYPVMHLLTVTTALSYCACSVFVLFYSAVYLVSFI